MSGEIRQYQITHQIHLSLWKRLAMFPCLAAFLFALRWAMEALFHWPHRSRLDEWFLPLMLALWFAFRPLALRPFYGGSLVVGEDFVEGRSGTAWFTFKKRIDRGRIRSISENKRGLLVMDRGEFAARMLGFVFVPASLPEYPEIRSELARWAPIRVKA